MKVFDTAALIQDRLTKRQRDRERQRREGKRERERKREKGRDRERKAETESLNADNGLQGKINKYNLIDVQTKNYKTLFLSLIVSYFFKT